MEFMEMCGMCLDARICFTLSTVFHEVLFRPNSSSTEIYIFHLWAKELDMLVTFFENDELRKCRPIAFKNNSRFNLTYLLTAAIFINKPYP